MKVQITDANRETSQAIFRKWMVVDDNKDILRLTAQMLARFTDAKICCFQSPEKAARAFEAEPDLFQLVVTDFEMFEMTGAELCRRLRLTAPESKIILTTGSVDISAEEAASLGFDAFLPKPFSMSALSIALDRAKSANTRLRAA